MYGRDEDRACICTDGGVSWTGVMMNVFGHMERCDVGSWAGLGVWGFGFRVSGFGLCTRRPRLKIFRKHATGTGCSDRRMHGGIQGSHPT
jgi:hypothetical protein